MFEDALVRRLADAGRRVLLVPHVYHLPDGHPALASLAASGPDAVLAAWLAPRAAEWVLRWRLGRDEAQAVRCFDMRAYDSGEECAAAVLAASGRGGPEAGAGTVEDCSGAVRARWYPVVDQSRCSRCGQCVEFCLFGVYVWRDERPIVANPDQCKPGCPACARVCPKGAIMFPHHDADPRIAGLEHAAAAPLPAPTDARAGAGETPDDIDRLIDELEALDSGDATPRLPDRTDG